jgi:hypothetical protein
MAMAYLRNKRVPSSTPIFSINPQDIKVIPLGAFGGGCYMSVLGSEADLYKLFVDLDYNVKNCDCADFRMRGGSYGEREDGSRGGKCKHMLALANVLKTLPWLTDERRNPVERIIRKNRWVQVRFWQMSDDERRQLYVADYLK